MGSLFTRLIDALSYREQFAIITRYCRVKSLYYDCLLVIETLTLTGAESADKQSDDEHHEQFSIIRRF